MSVATTALRRDPPWWVVLLTVPLVMTSIFFIFFSALGGVGLIDSVRASRQVTHSLPLPEGGAVTIMASAAGVVIEAGPAGQVSVDDWLQVKSPTRAVARTALTTFAESRLTATDGGVTIQVPSREDFNLLSFSINRKVTIRMPADAKLIVRGDAFAADVHDLTGDLDVSISSGAFRLKNVTVTGSDRIVATAGAVDFEGSLQGGTLDIATDSGAVNLKLPRGTNATYDLSTANGAIAVRPESGRQQATGGSDRSLTGVLGSGAGAVIRVRARSGAINLEVS